MLLEALALFAGVQLHGVELDAVEVDRETRQTAICWGDSTIRGQAPVGSTAGDRGTCEFIDGMLSPAERAIWRVVNRACNGGASGHYQTDYIPPRPQSFTCDPLSTRPEDWNFWAANVDSERTLARAVIYDIGVNDATSVVVLPGCTAAPCPADEYETNVTKTVNVWLAPPWDPTLEIVLLTPIYGPGTAFITPAQKAAVDGYAQKIRDVCAAQPSRVTCVDVHAQLPQPTWFDASDDIHPNATGQAAIAALVWTVVGSLMLP